MTDLSEFEAASKPAKMPCGVAAVFAQLEETDPDRAEALRAALAAEHIKGTAVSKVVSGWGYRLPQATVQRHRRGVCSCGD